MSSQPVIINKNCALQSNAKEAIVKVQIGYAGVVNQDNFVSTVIGTCFTGALIAAFYKQKYLIKLFRTKVLRQKVVEKKVKTPGKSDADVWMKKINAQYGAKK